MRSVNSIFIAIPCIACLLAAMPTHAGDNRNVASVLSQKVPEVVVVQAPVDLVCVRIQFAKDGSVLSNAENVSAMRFLAAAMKSNPHVRASIASKAEGDYAEASRRAFVVMDSLVANGVEKGRTDVRLASDVDMNAGDVIVVLVGNPSQYAAPAVMATEEKKLEDKEEAVKTDPALEQKVVGLTGKTLAVVYFDEGKVRIDKRYASHLDFVLKELKKEGNPSLLVNAYAEGSERNAERLAIERGVQLRKALVDRGYPADQISVESFSTRSFKTKVSKLKQRRAELTRK